MYNGSSKILDWLLDKEEDFDGPYEIYHDLHKFQGEVHSVDWVSSQLGISCYVRLPECIVKHSPSLALASKVCQKLMKDRKDVRTHIEKLEALPLTPEIAYTIRAQNQLQLSFKTAANSIYGSLIFKLYNTYSPRCWMSVTSTGKWALHATMTIIKGLGCSVLYGDTDSVMYSIPETLSSGINTPIMDCLEYLATRSLNFRASRIFLASKFDPSLKRKDAHKNRLRGIIPRIINYIISFTNLAALRIKQQGDGSKSSISGEWEVYRRMAVFAWKHYVFRCYDGLMVTKGLSYVRRSGVLLEDGCLERFISCLTEEYNRDSVMSELRTAFIMLRSTLEQRTNMSLFKVSRSKHGKQQDYLIIFKRRENSNTAMLYDLYNATDHRLFMRYYNKVLNAALLEVCEYIGHKNIYSVINA